MFENFDELMDETMEELQENETMEQDNAFENGNAEISPEEAEAVGRGEYSPEARAYAWNEYNRLSGKDRETFLRGHSRNAHIMNMELRNERAGSTTGEGETAEEKESVGYSSDYYKHELATAKNDIQRDYALKNYRAALARETVGSTTGEGEAAETTEDQESVGYSSDYYEHQMASALKNGNKIAYDNARSNWAKAKVKESVGSTTGEGEEEKHDSAYYEQKLREAMQKANMNGVSHERRRDWAEAIKAAGSTTGKGEAAETTEDQESVGYSSSYYEHEMASALKNGNRIAYDNARSNWAKAKVKESVGSTTGEGEAAGDPEAVGRYDPERAGGRREDYWDNRRGTPERVYRPGERRYAMGSTTGEGEAAETTEDQESVGYSSDYYEHQMASALKNGNKIAYDNARSNWAKAKVRESVGSTTGEGEAVDETKEAVGSSAQFWLNKATKDLAEGHMTAHKINMDRYYEALVKESVGYRAEDSIIEGLDLNERHGLEKRK